MSLVPPGNPHRLAAAPPDGDSRQADSHRPSPETEAAGSPAVTDRDPHHEREPPLCAEIGSIPIKMLAVQIWRFCAPHEVVV